MSALRFAESIMRLPCYPYVMLWQNGGNPAFVCIEPWYGMPDPDVTDHQWSKKPGLVQLLPGESFVTDQSISIE